MDQYYVLLLSLASFGYIFLGVSFNSHSSLIASRITKHIMFALTVISLAGALLPSWFAESGMQFGFSTAITWMFWLASILIWIEVFFAPEPLSARYIFFPAALGALLPIFFPSPMLSSLTSSLRPSLSP